MANINIEEIDENLRVDNKIDDTGLVWHSVDDEPFRIYGVFRAEDGYRRVPRDVAEATSEKVAMLSIHTSGGRVRFVTNSTRVAIRAILREIRHSPGQPCAGVHGFDLYCDGRYAKTFYPPLDITTGYESVVPFDGKENRLFTLNMPLYNNVYKLYIGLDEDAEIKRAPDYKYEKPVVYYGSSITQGACASRPGNCYQGFISRALDCNFINLGFGGNAKGEDAMAEYIASLDMSVFVMDYDHNSPSVEHLEATHGRFFDIIRKAQPNLPVIMISQPAFYLNNGDYERRQMLRIKKREIILKTYNRALATGDKNVYFIDGATLIGPELSDATVDGNHPTDLGFLSMANVILPVLKKALGEE